MSRTRKEGEGLFAKEGTWSWRLAVKLTSPYVERRGQTKTRKEDPYLQERKGNKVCSPGRKEKRYKNQAKNGKESRLAP